VGCQENLVPLFDSYVNEISTELERVH
jgi:hypothetical protein